MALLVSSFCGFFQVPNNKVPLTNSILKSNPVLSASVKSRSNFVVASALSQHHGSYNSSHIHAQVEGANSKSGHYPPVILSVTAYPR